VFDELTPEERARATRLVKRHAHDENDEAELMAMLGLDRARPAPPEPKPRGALTPAEVHDLLAPLAAERVHRPGAR
jgi:hypothetical protein